jgi:hypothetical protein
MLFIIFSKKELMRNLYSLTMATLLALVVAATTSPSAYASPGHELDIFPTSGSPGTIFELSMAVDEETPAILTPKTMVLFDHDEDAVFENNPDTCEALVAEPGDRLWTWLDDTSTAVFVSHDAHAAGESSVAIVDGDGSGDGAGEGFGSGGDTASTDDPVVPGIHFAGVTPFRWEDEGGLDDDTEEAGLYHFVSCGFIDLDGNGDFDSGVDLPNVIAETFRVTRVVGGEIMGTDAAALVTAGVGANVYTIIPVLAAIAGAGIFAARRWK